MLVCKWPYNCLVAAQLKFTTADHLHLLGKHKTETYFRCNVAVIRVVKWSLNKMKSKENAITAAGNS